MENQISSVSWKKGEQKSLRFLSKSHIIWNHEQEKSTNRINKTTLRNT